MPCKSEAAPKRFGGTVCRTSGSKHHDAKGFKEPWGPKNCILYVPMVRRTMARKKCALAISMPSFFSNVPKPWLDAPRAATRVLSCPCAAPQCLALLSPPARQAGGAAAAASQDEDAPQAARELRLRRAGRAQQQQVLTAQGRQQHQPHLRHGRRRKSQRQSI